MNIVADKKDSPLNSNFHPVFKEYINIVDVETLERLEKICGRVLVAVAVRIGTARLIDNIVVDTSG